MAEKTISRVHAKFSGQEIREASLEKLAAHPTGPDLYEGRFWHLTTDDHVYFYSGGAIRQIANINDLNKFGAYVGGHDASSGTVPASGSGVNEVGSPDLSIEAGDTWRITVAGTIVGLGGGDDNLSPGDLLIALTDGASVAGDFMAVQLNLDDAVLDEVQNFANQTVFPATGDTGVIYIADDINEAFIWDGAAYTAVSLPNILHYGTLGSFPATGDQDILYVADDTQLVYFWDGSSYVPLSGVFSNFYATDGALTGNRTVSGASNNLTFTGILAYTLSTATYDLVTAGNMEEVIGGNKIVTVTGSSSETSAGKTIISTGSGNSVSVVTDPDGALIIPKDANPDGNVSAPITAMLKYDTTDDDFRGYQGASWRSLINIERFADLASFPATGNPDKIYIAEDTDYMYIWDGASYVLNSGSNLYTTDGSIVGDRTVTGDESLLLFTNTNWRAITGDGAYFDATADEINVVGPGGITLTGNTVVNGVTPAGAGLTVYGTGGAGTVLQGLALSVNPSEFTLQLRDGNGATTNLFRNSGRVDLATNGAPVNVGIINGPFQLNVADDMRVLAATGNAEIELYSTLGQALIQINAQAANQDSYIHFANASNNEITIGWDESETMFKMGTTALTTGTFYEYDTSISEGRHASSLGIGGTFPGTTTRLAVRGIGTTTDQIIRAENVSGTDRFIINDAGQQAWGIGATATINASFGHVATVNGYNYGFGFYANNCTTSGFTVQMQGTTTTGLSVASQNSPSGTLIGIQGNILGSSSTNNYGINGLARNGSSLNYGVFGQASGGAIVTPSVRSAGVAGSSGTNVDDLTYGGYFTAVSAFSGLRTNNLIGVYGLGSNSAVATGSTSVAIGGQFSTSTISGSGGAAVNGNMALNVPATGNDGNVVIGADSVGANASMLEVTGNSEVIDGQFFVDQVTDTMAANAFTVDWDEGNNTVVDLQGSTGAVTATLNNPKAGAWYTIKVIQGTNLDNITWPAAVLWRNGSSPTITTTNDAIDLIQLYYDGTNYLAIHTPNFG